MRDNELILEILQQIQESAQKVVLCVLGSGHVNHLEFF